MTSIKISAEQKDKLKRDKASSPESKFDWLQSAFEFVSEIKKKRP